MPKNYKVVREKLSGEIGNGLLQVPSSARTENSLKVWERLADARTELNAAIQEACQVLETHCLVPLIVEALTVRRCNRGDGLLISAQLIVDEAGYLCLEGRVGLDQLEHQPVPAPVPILEQGVAVSPFQVLSETLALQPEPAKTKPKPTEAPPETEGVPVEPSYEGRMAPVNGRLPEVKECRAWAQHHNIQIPSSMQSRQKMMNLINETLDSREAATNPDDSEVAIQHVEIEPEPAVETPPKLVGVFNNTVHESTPSGGSGTAKADEGIGSNVVREGPSVLELICGTSQEPTGEELEPETDQPEQSGKDEEGCGRCGDLLAGEGQLFTSGGQDEILCASCYADAQQELSKEEPEPEPAPTPQPKPKMMRTSPALSVRTKPIDPTDGENDDVLSLLGNSAVVTGDGEEDSLDGMEEFFDATTPPPKKPAQLLSLTPDLQDMEQESEEGPPTFPPPGAGKPIRQLSSLYEEVDVNSLVAPDDPGPEPADEE